MRWWAEQEEDTRELVSRLVAEGQLDFVNGGYVQNDEATSHYVAMIDQTTRGHMYVCSQLHRLGRAGVCLDFAWAVWLVCNSWEKEGAVNGPGVNQHSSDSSAGAV
jgi:hypothetical protein